MAEGGRGVQTHIRKSVDGRANGEIQGGGADADGAAVAGLGAVLPPQGVRGVRAKGGKGVRGERGDFLLAQKAKSQRWRCYLNLGG